MSLPSEFDNTYFPLHRQFINDYIDESKVIIEQFQSTAEWLEIGPQKQSHIRSVYADKSILSLDIDDTYTPDVIADLTISNPGLASGRFAGIFCMEVLEHVVDPFAAVSEIARILEDGGFVVVSTPLNARIHGPVPDCWRFTEFGLKVLFRNFDIIDFKKLDTPDRNLFPLHYALIARKNTQKNIEARKMQFSYID